MTTEQTTDTATAIVAKVTPPVGVSLATVAGYQVSELMIWATLIYTVLMICHKLYQIYKEVKD
jgi:hypothetical protein